MAYTTEQIRNIALAGHGSTGKTTFLEHLLFTAKSISAPNSISSGKTVSDYTPEEIESGLSIHLSLASLTWESCKINVLDTPGSSDFIGEVVAAFRSCESAVMLVGARAGVQIETMKLWRRLDKRNRPRMVFVNKMDEERADFDAILEDLRERFDVSFVPVSVPVGSADSFGGVVDLINQTA